MVSCKRVAVSFNIVHLPKESVASKPTSKRTLPYRGFKMCITSTVKQCAGPDPEISKGERIHHPNKTAFRILASICKGFRTKRPPALRENGGRRTDSGSQRSSLKDNPQFRPRHDFVKLQCYDPNCNACAKKEETK